jgi:hypothetical protein
VLFRRTGASMKSTTINSLLDQIQFFSQEFPVFAKTGESFNMTVITGNYEFPRTLTTK